MIDRVGAPLGVAGAFGFREWVAATGRPVDLAADPWLGSPIGMPGRIGPGFYARLAEREKLTIRPAAEAGLIPDLAALAGPGFDPAAIRPEIHAFYRRTTAYRLAARGYAPRAARPFLWAWAALVGRPADQLNVPAFTSLPDGRMTNAVLPLCDAAGRRVHTGWLRQAGISGPVVYAGLYSVNRIPGHNTPCVRAAYPIPGGTVAVFLRPSVTPSGGLALEASGARFGESGIYWVVETRGGLRRARYAESLRLSFDIYVDADGVLRADHAVRLLGRVVFRLSYVMELAPFEP